VRAVCVSALALLLLAGHLPIAQAENGWRLSFAQAMGRIDYQLLHMRDEMTFVNQGHLMAAEIELAATLSNGERDVLDVAVQWPYYSQMDGIDGRGRRLHFFNAYGIYKFGLGKPNLRFGQFVVPFGNLPYYETHTRPLQSMFGESIGIRIDRGISLEGMFGHYDYWLAVMGGNGEWQDNNRAPMASTRVARRFDLPRGPLNLAISALYGSDMPRFSPLVDPMMAPMTGMDGMDDGHGGGYGDGHAPENLLFTDKFRTALDAEWQRGPAIWRIEFVAGRDGDGLVNGQFLEWNRIITEQDEVTVQAVRWEQPDGWRTRAGLSLAHKPSVAMTVRLNAEFIHARAWHTEQRQTMLALQFLLEIPRLWSL